MISKPMKGPAAGASKSGLLVRKSGFEDVSRIMEIIAMAVEYMKSHSIAQWNSDYPKKEQFLLDIARGESYVCILDGEIAGTAALSLEEEPNYLKIYNGCWISAGNYGVIHRLAVDDRRKGHGIAKAFVDYIEKMCINAGISAVRVDTHRDNGAMRRFLEKQGFIYCGVIYLPDGNPRVAYEKILGNN